MNENIEARGERLKKKRLEKGLSLQDVHKKTKIHPKILEALEQDATLNMNPVYLRGFLKIYCQFLGVDPQEYIKDIKKEIEYPVKYKEAPASAPVRLKLSITKPHPKVLKAIAIVVIVIAALFAVYKMGHNLNSYLKSKSAKGKKSSQSVVTPKAESKPKETESPKPPISSDIRLGIHARYDCWLKVKVDGKTVFERILKKGQSETWHAKDRIDLQIGNPLGIDLEVNGKILSPLGKKGKAVKRAVITKEGFEVLR